MSAREASGAVLSTVALIYAGTSLWQVATGRVVLLPGRPRMPSTAARARQGGWVGFALGVILLIVGLSWLTRGIDATILGAAAWVLLFVGAVSSARILRRWRQGSTR